MQQEHQHASLTLHDLIAEKHKLEEQWEEDRQRLCELH